MVKIGTVDPLSLLERKDKWFLGGGKGAIYAPPFPRWLESPGFWDESYFADIRLTRLFTVLFCDFGGRPVRLRGEMVSWRPDRMILEHRSPYRFIRETRVVTEDHEWVSVFELLEGEPLHAFVWSLPELKEPGYGAPWQSLTGCEVDEDGIRYEFSTSWPGELEPDRTGIDAEHISEAKAEMLPPLALQVDLSANQPRLGYTVNLAQRHDDPPLWQSSLLPQKLRDGRLPGDFKLWVGPPPMEGLVHLLQQYEFRIDEPLVVLAKVSIARPQRASKGFEVVATSERAWRDYFASVPRFSSSDPFLTNAYWYRWYGLRLNTVDIPELPIGSGIGFQPMRSETFQVSDSSSSGVKGQDGPGTHRLEADATFSPFITEGVGFFRNFVTYSAQAHLREVAWMHSPRLALGILENLGKCQREDGSFPGHNYSCRPARDFYHADFATGAKLARTLHPTDFQKRHLKPLARYAWYLISERKIGWGGKIELTCPDSKAHGSFAIFDQNETGQEYMSRYQFVTADADQWQSFVVGGCDATTYACELIHLAYRHFKVFRNSKYISSDNLDDCAYGLVWQYNKTESFFCDITLDGTRSPARPATGFYPLLSLFPERYLSVLQRWLFNPSEFWLPKGFPATALSDTTFSEGGEWKDKRLNCPWSGRSWPMVNSHLVDVIANVARWMEPSDIESERRRVEAERIESSREQMIAELLEAFGSEEPEAEGILNSDSESQVQSDNFSGSTEPESLADLPYDDFEPEEESISSPFAVGELRAKASEALMKAITLMFHDGDPARPNSYEHYDPITGTPSLYRGYDDYMHSWIVDLIIRHAVGVIPGEDHVDPLPLGLDWIECSDIPHPKGRMHVRIEKDIVTKLEIVVTGT